MKHMRTRRLPRSTDDDRYLTQRTNKNGTVRCYWQPPGQKPVRLPDGPGMTTMLTQLNQRRDATRTGNVVVEDSVAWVIQKYRESDRYQNCSDSTKSVYERWLVEFDRRLGALPCTAEVLTRRVAVKMREKYKGHPSVQKQALTVLYNVIEEARDQGIFTGEKPASKLRLSSAPARDAVWSPKNREAWLKAASRHRHAAALEVYFYLMEYTAQRPSDCRKMRWDRYDGEFIDLVQQKTGKLMRVSCHVNLRRVLDKAKRNTNSMSMVAKPSGRPFDRNTLGIRFREVCVDAGIGPELQARDLRRTAVVRLLEAGCTEVETSSITGHSIEATRRILETYAPRTATMSTNARAKWERNET